MNGWANVNFHIQSLTDSSKMCTQVIYQQYHDQNLEINELENE